MFELFSTFSLRDVFALMKNKVCPPSIEDERVMTATRPLVA